MKSEDCFRLVATVHVRVPVGTVRAGAADEKSIDGKSYTLHENH